MQKKNEGTNQANICFDCEKALGGCVWSQTLTTVPEGATYEPVYDDKGQIDTYHITACPLFDPSPERRSVGILSEEENERFLQEHAYRRRPYTRRAGV